MKRQSTIIKPRSFSEVLSKFTFLSLLIGLVLQPLFAAEQDQSYDRIKLRVEVSREVENDTLEAVLFYQREGGDATKLAKEVNKKIADALKLAKQKSEIKVQTLGYQTTPVYRKQILTGWRVKQSIRLKSQNAAGLSNLIGELQEILAVQSVGYNVSRNKRNETENGLISEAIESFQQRAKLITESLGRSTFRLVQMDVNTQDMSPRPMMRNRAFAAKAEDAAPTLEAGTQTLRVTVSGTIELVIK